MKKLPKVLIGLCSSLATELEASYGPSVLAQCYEEYVLIRQAQILLNVLSNKSLPEETIKIMRKIEEATNWYPQSA